MIALSIRQPWAWAILHLPELVRKDVENRDWPTRFRGKFLVHAGKGCTRSEYADAVACIIEAQEERADALSLNDQIEPTRPPPLYELPRGAIVGWSEILECTDHATSPWYSGAYAFRLGRRGILKPIPCRGALGFFRVPEDVAETVRRQAQLTPAATSEASAVRERPRNPDEVAANTSTDKEER